MQSLRGCLLLLAITSVPVLVLAQGAVADSDPIPAGVPWTNQTHDTPLELLASRIASHIAGRRVNVDCETAAAWTALATQTGAKAGSESGYVATLWNSSNGQMISSSNTAQLAPSVCQPLDSFATATSKPTTCLPAARDVLNAGRMPKTGRYLEPCYLGGGKTTARISAAFWASYSNYSVAILTLAHESVHLSGIVGGTLSNGLQVGDQQAEAKADCYGMQWMPYVAEQLGDTPADAQTIALYFWEKIYPLGRRANPAYWSQACRPGGQLDARRQAEKPWP